jgi:anti-sigma B factor antagonist
LPEYQSKVHSDRSHNLILDFTHVPYVDSIGMGTLVDVNIRHRRDGNSVSLLGASDRVRSVLKLARVDRFFRFFNSLAEAQAKRD